MADSVVRITLNSSEYDQKLKRAADGLRRFSDECRKVGGTMEVVEKDTLDYVKAIGQMETTSRTATGKLAEMKKAFIEFSAVYKDMTDQEKQSPMGKALAQSLDQLKVRISDSKKQLEEINRELNGSKFGQFGSVIDSVGQKFGITGNLTEMLTSKTALLTGAIGAASTAVAYATKEWAAYNTELAKQDQITTVTTGLKNEDAERMTSAMRALSRTYGADFRQAINAANTLMTQFGATGDEAIQLLKDGMQGMIMGDAPKLLQMIQQFAPAFRDAGVGASQLVAVIQNSEGGLFSEQNMNAILMGIKNIRLMTDSTSKALAKMGIDGQEMSRKMSDGSMTVFEALRQVATALEGAKAGSKEAGEVMQYVFGRQGAMQGMKLARAIAELNTNLEETKKQTGEVGESMAQLQDANERLEVAIRNCFGYDGWETMANGIKTQLVTALAGVLELTIKIKDSWVGEISGTIFDAISKAALTSLGPLGRVLSVMNDIRKGFGGNTEGGGGTQRTELDDFFDYIKGGNTKAERESRYNEKMTELVNRMSVLGQEKQVKNADGSTSFKIDPEELKYRDVLMQRRLALAAQREALLNAPYAQQTSKPEPFTPLPTPTGGGKTIKEEKDEFTEIIGLIGNAQEQVNDLQKQISESWDEGEIAKLTADLKVAQEELQRLKDIGKPKNFVKGISGFNSVTMATWMQGRQGDLSKVEYGSANYKDITANIADMQTIKTIMEQRLKAGLDAVDADGIMESLWERVFDGENIQNNVWQSMVDTINEKLKGMNLETIKINFETGEIAKTGKETEKSWQAAAHAVQSVGGALQSLEDPSAKIAGVIGQAIANIALGFAQASASDSKLGVLGWIAAIAGGLATMTSTIATIHSATGYAQGGIIKGSSYSGDNILATVGNSGSLAGLNAGELVLNRAQTAGLAQELEGSGGGRQMVVRGVLHGKDIFIAAENWAKSVGKGEFVTW